MCEQRLIRQKDVSPAGSLGKEHCRGRERPGQRAEVGACLPVPGSARGSAWRKRGEQAEGRSGRQRGTKGPNHKDFGVSLNEMRAVMGVQSREGTRSDLGCRRILLAVAENSLWQGDSLRGDCSNPGEEDSGLHLSDKGRWGRSD